MARRQPSLARFADPGAVLAFLHDKTRDGEHKNTLLRALVFEAQSENSDADTATSLVIVALWPGLDARRKRLLRHFQDGPDVLGGELIGRLSQAIATTNLDRVTWIAATLLRNIERDIMRDLARQADGVSEVPVEDCPDLLHGATNRGHGVLKTLRAEIGSDADLVMAVAAFGFSQREAARALGLSYEAARKRYQRAISRLSEKFGPFDD